MMRMTGEELPIDNTIYKEGPLLQIVLHRYAWSVLVIESGIRTSFQLWQTQSGAGYVYIDCFGFLNLICPSLFLWPSTIAC